MKLHKIIAVFKKTAKDMAKNKRELLFFLMFPLMTHFFNAVMPESEGYFPIVFLPMNVLFCSMAVMSGLIAEEKEKGTLKSLMFANVKPSEYFIGTGLFILIATIISSSLFMPLISISGMGYIKIYLSLILNSICSMILGAVLGLLAHNQMAANGITAPVTIVLGMLPMVGAMNAAFRKVSLALYTTRFADTIADLSAPITWGIVLTYILNFIVCIIIFSLVYKKKKLNV